MGEQRIRVTAIRRALSAALIAVSAAGLAVELLHHGPLPALDEDLVGLFSLSYEGNLPTWYSSALLLACAITLAAIAPSAPTGQARYWGLLSAVFLVVHVTTAVVDSYVDIAWWQALSPFDATYRPLWLGIGAVSLDLILVVIVTSLLRHRMPYGLWRTLHFSTYAAWALGVVHGLGIGTDTGATAATAAYLASVGCVVIALGVRVHSRQRSPESVKNTDVPSPYFSGVIR